MKRILPLVVLLACPAAWAQTAPQAPRVEKKDPKAPIRRGSQDLQFRALQDATRNEERRSKILSDRSRKRHDKAANAIQNER